MPVRPQKHKPLRPQIAVLDLTEYSLAQKIRSSRRWQGLERAVLKRDPLCCDPFGRHAGVLKPTRHAHHIKGLKTHPELAFDMNNLAGICEECHQVTEVHVRRGISTEHLFGGFVSTRFESIVMAAKSCSPQNNGFYCARMKTFRTTKCAGCNL